jgi:hypothetical protein
VSFKTTLLKAVQACVNVQVGVGIRMQELCGMYYSKKQEGLLLLRLETGELEAHDQDIEVDEDGCALFTDTAGYKHALVLQVHRALTEQDIAPQEAVDA